MGELSDSVVKYLLQTPTISELRPGYEGANIGTIIGFLVTFVVFIGGVILWIVCLIKGYSGTMWRMPFVAQFADKIMGAGPATA